MTPLHWMTAEGSGTVVFPFLSMQGGLLPAQPTFDREQRAGVNGIGVWATGTRGEPFQITTTLDCADAAAAATALAAYGATVLSKKDLYYCGLLWGTVMIQKVTLGKIQKFDAAVGGINDFTGGSGAVLTAIWTIETLA